MKTTHPLRRRTITLAAAAITWASAHGVVLNVDVRLWNLTVTPQAGTPTYLTDWELEAAASAFDSVNGFAGDYQWASGQPSTVQATADTGLVFAQAQATVDATGLALDLRTGFHVADAIGSEFASAFSGATAYREFELTGGSGTVNVTFGFDYEATLQCTDPARGLEYSAGLRLFDGVRTWDLLAAGGASGLVDRHTAGTLSDTFMLEFDKAYSLTLINDPETPEPAGAAVVTALLLLGMAGIRTLFAVAYKVTGSQLTRASFAPRNGGVN